MGTVLGPGGSSLVAGRGGLGLETTSGGGVVLGLDGGGGVFTVGGRMVGFPWSPVGGWSMEEEREHLEVVVPQDLSVNGGLLEQLVDWVTPVPATLLLLVFSSSSHSSHM